MAFGRKSTVRAKVRGGLGEQCRYIYAECPLSNMHGGWQLRGVHRKFSIDQRNHGGSRRLILRN